MDILKNRNFLLLFLGRIFTNIGDSLYYVAAMWLVYKLSGNPFILDWLVPLRYYLLHYNFLLVHSSIDGQ